MLKAWAKRTLASQLRQLCQRRLLSTAVHNERKKLVILGTGWASYALLTSIDKSKYDVIVVSPRNHFLFTPLLCSTTVGTLEFRSIIEPVRNTGFRHGKHFHLAFATGVDVENQLIHCESALRKELTYSLPYDHLVIGVGALSNTFGVPGVNEHALFLKEVADARKIRNRLLSNFELAVQPDLAEDERRRLLHTVIVGGGPTGVEFGAELYDFVEQDVSRLFGKDEQTKSQVTLVESNKILGSFDSRLQKYAEKKISQRDRFTLKKTSVTEVGRDFVKLANGEVLACGLVVWSTGLAPRWFTQQLPVTRNDRGQIVTDSHLRVLDAPSESVFAIGDCADIDDQPLPCTAQVAERQGRYLAQRLSIDDVEQRPPFKFTSAGMLAYIGGYEGVTDTPDLKAQGFPSWFLWRSAYLTKLGSWRLRMQVPLDWTKTIIFGRDVSRF